MVGRVDDSLEHEADHVADQVMQIPGPDLSVTSTPLHVSRTIAAREEQEAKMLQTKAEGSAKSAAGDVPAIVHEVLRSPGQPLDPGPRAFLEPHFAHDFSRVRIHTDARAAEASHALRAHAFTQGEHIVFAGGRYRPGTADGLRLVGHELAHVVQQAAGRVASSPTNASIVTDRRLEREADIAGGVLARGQRAEGLGSVEKRGTQLYAPGGPIQLDAESEDFKVGYEDGLSGLERRGAPRAGDALVDYDEGYSKGHYELTQHKALPASAAKQPPSQTNSSPLPAGDAIGGVQFEFLAPPLPPTGGTIDRFNFKRGPYLLVPQLRDKETDTPKVVYYICYRTDAKRNEYVIGPDSLDLFTSNLDVFKTMGDTAFADPDVIDYIVGFGDAVWDQQGDTVTQYLHWLGLRDMEQIHASMVQEGKRIRDEQRNMQQRRAKETMAKKVLPLVNAAMMAAAAVRLLAAPRAAPAPAGGAGAPAKSPAPALEPSELVPADERPTVPPRGQAPKPSGKVPAPAPAAPAEPQFGKSADGYETDRIFRDWVGPIPAEGWKLHVSPDVASAEGAADAVLPVLRRMKVDHKVVSSAASYGQMSGTQAGKFITIYPQNPAQAQQIVDAVDAAVAGKGLKSVGVAGEKPVGTSGLVYTRYGGFTKETVTDPATGKEVPDVRGHIKPDWIADPWAAPAKPSQPQPALPLSGSGNKPTE
jgi:hypothetical protein